MNVKAWIDDYSPRFSYSYGYTRCGGDGVWYKTCDLRQLISTFEILKKL
jgi:hypothetical protein